MNENMNESARNNHSSNASNDDSNYPTDWTIPNQPEVTPPEQTPSIKPATAAPNAATPKRINTRVAGLKRTLNGDFTGEGPWSDSAGCPPMNPPATEAPATERVTSRPTTYAARLLVDGDGTELQFKRPQRSEDAELNEMRHKLLTELQRGEKLARQQQAADAKAAWATDFLVKHRKAAVTEKFAVRKVAKPAYNTTSVDEAFSSLFRVALSSVVGLTLALTIWIALS